MDRPDPQEPWVLLKLAEAEDAQRDLLLTIELSAATRELHTLSGWQKMVERIGLIERGEVEKLRISKMDPYDLGRRQGALRALRLITNAKAMTEQELALAKSEATILDARIAELRNLLT